MCDEDFLRDLLVMGTAPIHSITAERRKHCQLFKAVHIFSGTHVRDSGCIFLLAFPHPEPRWHAKQITSIFQILSFKAGKWRKSLIIEPLLRICFEPVNLSCLDFNRELGVPLEMTNCLFTEFITCIRIFRNQILSYAKFTFCWWKEPVVSALISLIIHIVYFSVTLFLVTDFSISFCIGDHTIDIWVILIQIEHLPYRHLFDMVKIF